MKKVLFIVGIMNFALCMNISAQYYNTDPGKSFRYEETNNDGNVIGYSTYTNTDVQGSGTNWTIDQTLVEEDFHKGKLRSSNGSPVTVQVDGGNYQMIFHASGSHKKLKVNIEGPGFQWPYSMKVGQKLSPLTINASVKLIIFSETAQEVLDDRSVIGKETVTTPAGTFECMKIQEKGKMVFGGGIGIDIFGRHGDVDRSQDAPQQTDTNIKRTIWVAKNVGMVKMIETDAEGKDTNYILTEIR